MKIFQLWDCIINEHLSYHVSVKSAMIEMSKHVAKLAPALENDYSDDPNIDFEMKYRIKSFTVQNNDLVKKEELYVKSYCHCGKLNDENHGQYDTCCVPF